MRFEHSSTFQVPIEELFQYHESPTALDRLLPPLDNVVIRKRSDGISSGQCVVLRMKLLPGISIDWNAEHVDYEPPFRFTDVQRSGPFHAWNHSHIFSSVSESKSQLTDSIEYSISRFKWIESLANSSLQRKLKSMFNYRHFVTAADFEFAFQLRLAGQKLVISGASGLLGRRVIAIALALGAEVIMLERVHSAEDVENFQPTKKIDIRRLKQSPWHVASGSIRESDWKNVDAFIHLAGANIAGKRWSERYKAMLRSSRVDATQKLVAQLISKGCLPKSMVTASGTGFYPSSQDQLLQEDDANGADFLGTLAKDWEDASSIVRSHGTRWSAARLGMVLDPKQGALVPLLWQWKLFAGGRIGDGNMYWSWIERDDAARALLWIACRENCSGPYNLSGTAVTNREFAATLSKVLHRPSIIPAPEFAVRMALGEMADGLLLRSNRADNTKLLRSGFPIQLKTLEPALRHLLN